MLAFFALALPERLFPHQGAQSPPWAELQSWRADVKALLTELRQKRPVANSTEELALQRRYIRLTADLAQQLGAEFTGALEDGMVEGLQELVEEDVPTASPRRRFALRELGRALDTLGVFIEAMRSVFEVDSGNEHFVELADHAAEEIDAGEPLPEEVVHSTRFNLALMVGLEFLNELDDDELVYWATTASQNARRLDVLLASGFVRELRGELARLRSMHAWETWDDEELERELQPWGP